jgi:magnesium-dependent phosphatase 1
MLNDQDKNGSNDDFIDPQLVKHWKSLANKPKVIVFDLDFTLWPCYIQTLDAPIRKIDDQCLIDSNGDKYTPFKDVTKILRTLREKCLGPDGYLAVASRSVSRELAINAIDIFGWSLYFSSVHVYPRIKDEHLRGIKADLNFESFRDVLFFDDDHKNYKPVYDLGAMPYLVNKVDGLNMLAMCEGLTRFSKKYRVS